MKKNYLFKILLLLLAVNIIVGCSSSTMPPDTKHWHGKDYHKIEKGYVPPSTSPNKIKHEHHKDFHKMEITQ